MNKVKNFIAAAWAKIVSPAPAITPVVETPVVQTAVVETPEQTQEVILLKLLDSQEQHATQFELEKSELMGKLKKVNADLKVIMKKYPETYDVFNEAFIRINTSIKHLEEKAKPRVTHRMRVNRSRAAWAVLSKGYRSPVSPNNNMIFSFISTGRGIPQPADKVVISDRELPFPKVNLSNSFIINMGSKEERVIPFIITE